MTRINDLTQKQTLVLRVIDFKATYGSKIITLIRVELNARYRENKERGSFDPSSISAAGIRSDLKLLKSKNLIFTKKQMVEIKVRQGSAKFKQRNINVYHLTESGKYALSEYMRILSHREFI